MGAQASTQTGKDARGSFSLLLDERNRAVKEGYGRKGDAHHCNWTKQAFAIDPMRGDYK